MFHRDGDLPAHTHTDFGLKAWWKHGKRHREEDKPAEIYTAGSGSAYWYFNGRLHRDGGKPAAIVNEELRGYWIHGKQVYPDE